RPAGRLPRVVPLAAEAARCARDLRATRGQRRRGARSRPSHPPRAASGRGSATPPRAGRASAAGAAPAAPADDDAAAQLPGRLHDRSARAAARRALETHPRHLTILAKTPMSLPALTGLCRFSPENQIYLALTLVVGSPARGIAGRPRADEPGMEIVTCLS